MGMPARQDNKEVSDGEGGRVWIKALFVVFRLLVETVKERSSAQLTKCVQVCKVGRVNKLQDLQPLEKSIQYVIQIYKQSNR